MLQKFWVPSALTGCHLALSSVNSKERNITRAKGSKGGGEEWDNRTGESEQGEEDDNGGKKRDGGGKRANVKIRPSKTAPATIGGGPQGLDWSLYSHARDQVSVLQQSDSEDFESDIDDPAVWAQREPQGTRSGQPDNEVDASTVDETPDEDWMHDAKKVERIEELENWQTVLQGQLTEIRGQLRELRGY